MKPTKLLLLLLLLFVYTACSDDDGGVTTLPDGEEPDNVIGLNYAEAVAGDFTPLYEGVIDALDDVADISIIARINHASAAAGAGVSLKATRVLLFGNPALGTPLLEENQRVGLDLPQKLLVYQTNDDDVIVAYNNTEYIARRHGVAGVSTLVQISNALGSFALNATGSSIVNADDNQVNFDEGIVEMSTDSLSVATFYNNLLNLLAANPDISIMAEVDHQANAAAVNRTLRPTRLVVFGNPNLGSPLMKDQRSTAIDLPQKMLVYEAEDGSVKLIYNDPFYLATRHRADQTLPVLTTMSNALNNLATSAMQN